MPYDGDNDQCLHRADEPLKGLLVVVESRDRLLTPGEVASLFRVDPKTVTRWAAAGRINSIRTPGGHRRFRESEIRELLRQDGAKAAVPAPAPRQAGDDQPAAHA